MSRNATWCLFRFNHRFAVCLFNCFLLNSMRLKCGSRSPGNRPGSHGARVFFVGPSVDGYRLINTIAKNPMDRNNATVHIVSRLAFSLSRSLWIAKIRLIRLRIIIFPPLHEWFKNLSGILFPEPAIKTNAWSVVPPYITRPAPVGRWRDFVLMGTYYHSRQASQEK